MSAFESVAIGIIKPPTRSEGRWSLPAVVSWSLPAVVSESLPAVVSESLPAVVSGSLPAVMSESLVEDSDITGGLAASQSSARDYNSSN